MELSDGELGCVMSETIMTNKFDHRTGNSVNSVCPGEASEWSDEASAAD